MSGIQTGPPLVHNGGHRGTGSHKRTSVRYPSTGTYFRRSPGEKSQLIGSVDEALRPVPIGSRGGRWAREQARADVLDVLVQGVVRTERTLQWNKLFTRVLLKRDKEQPRIQLTTR